MATTPKSDSTAKKGKRFDIIRDGSVYIRTLPKKAADAFVEKQNGKAKEAAKVAGRTSYLTCEAVPTSENKTFYVRQQIRSAKEGVRWETKTNTFKKRKEALNFAHQIPNTFVTIS